MHERIQTYVDILQGKDKAESTVTEYTKGLELFSEWLAEEDIEPEDVSSRDLQRYLGYLKGEKGYAPKTIRLKFVAVNQFYEDMVAEGDIDHSPAEHIEVSDWAPKRTKKEEITKERRVWMEKEELEQVVENVPAPQVRNRLLILFQYYTALRRQEVCDVKISDLNREERKVQVRGKNGTIHTAHWQPRMDTLLTAWLDGGYRNGSPYSRESDYLFLTESSPQLSGSRLNDIVKQAAENAGIQEVLYTNAGGNKQYKITSHTLRHSFGMHFLENGGSIEALSKNLAHSSVTTTEIYGEIQDERAGEEYEKYAPTLDI
ncbi:site-specific tyrosine recombinase XerD [Salinarchaeum chitinilyticum]